MDPAGAESDPLGRSAPRVLVDARDVLERHPDAGDTWEFLRILGDPAALDVAIACWWPGETRITECASLLARLAGSFEDLPKHLRQEALLAERDILTRGPHGEPQ